MDTAFSPAGALAGLRAFASRVLPGVAVAGALAVCAQFVSEHYGAPAMLMALLFGIAFHFLAEEGRCVPGIAFASRTVLRLGVALLGARISVELLIGLGPALIGLVVAGTACTILFALALAPLLGRGWRFALLTGGAVAICGASAAMAIAAVLPARPGGEGRAEQDLIFTVLGVTVLSTVAMVLYPFVVAALEMSPVAAGAFLGGTIHDVAQVVGAGFSVSEEVGETATLVKLIRVTTLAPVVLIFALAIRAADAGPAAGRRPPLMPSFVAAFLVLAGFNSLGLVPEAVRGALSDLSRWALLTAIAAVGMKTSLRSMLDVGGAAMVLIVAETLFIGGFVLAGLAWLGT